MSLESDVIDEFKDGMKSSLESLRSDLGKLRTGRANISILDGVRVDYYGTSTPLAQCANMAVPDARLITIKPYDKSVIGEIEKAITRADLGLNPQNDGNVVRVPIPALTEDRRRELVRHCRKTAEDFRVSIRNHRRDALEGLKSLEKDKDITGDDRRHASEKVEAATKDHVTRLDELLKSKEQEIMAV